MSSIYPIAQIEEDNVTHAWAKALARVTRQSVEALVPLTVIVNLQEGKMEEDTAVRKSIDSFLSRYSKIHSCNTTASTIFPQSYWNPSLGRKAFYDRYERNLPRIRKQRGNAYGLYFERMISYNPGGSSPKPVNQLEDLILSYNGGNHRASRMQLMIVDPMRDMTNQPMRGFPCLQQINFIPLAQDELIVIGNYGTQYLVDRAYGNYLGLYRLGQFVASQLNKRLVKVICTTAKAEIGTPTKTAAQQLVAEIQAMIPSICLK